MRINPILQNEMKTDSRRFRFFLLLMIYITLLGLPTLAIYQAICRNDYFEAQAFIGLYVFLACMEAIVLMFLVPALSASSICGEREKQTLDILLTTKMTPRGIIYGKLMVVVVKVLLLIICTLPVYSVVLFLGGIKMSHIIVCNIYLMITTLFVAAMSMWVSTMVKTSKMANVIAYFMELGFVIGLPIALFLVAAVTIIVDEGELIEKIFTHFIFFSPALGYGYLLFDQLGATTDLLYMFDDINLLMPGWMISISVEVLLTILFVEMAIKRLNPIKKKGRRKAVSN